MGADGHILIISKEKILEKYTEEKFDQLRKVVPHGHLPSSRLEGKEYYHFYYDGGCHGDFDDFVCWSCWWAADKDDKDDKKLMKELHDFCDWIKEVGVHWEVWT